MWVNQYGGDATFIDRMATNYATHNARINARWFSPLKDGETSRKCVICGADYKPKGRTQKYCSKSCARQAAYMKRRCDSLKCH